jgi:oligopeptidase B
MSALHTQSGYRKFFIIPLVCAFIIMENCSRRQASSEKVLPPIAKRVTEVLTLHGHTRIDDYYWLRERENPEVVAYLDAENDYAEKVMSHTDHLQEILIEEFQNLSEQPSQHVTYKKGDYIYYARVDKEKQYPIYCRKKVIREADEEVLLDANQLAEGHDVFALAEMQISPKQDILAYGMDTTGDRDFFTFYFKDLKTGKLFSDEIPDAHHLTAWANDNKTLFYVRGHRMYSHRLGTDPSEDKFYIGNVSFLYKSKSDQYVLIFSKSHPWKWRGYIDANSSNGSIIEVMSLKSDAQCFGLEHIGEKFYFLDNGILKEIQVGNKKLDDESKVIFHQEDMTIRSFEVFKDHLVLWEIKDSMKKLRIISLRDGKEHYLDFGESIYSVSEGLPRDFALRSLCNAEFNSHLLRYTYSSPTAPDSIYDYNMVTGKRTLVSQKKMGSEFDPNDYQAEILKAMAKDGTPIPISLVYHKSIKKDGENPLLLEGYGMYGVRESLDFSFFGLSLLNRGFILAIAHVRGGGELPGWHKEGMLLKKKNSFTDFIACARYLIDQGYTNPDRLFARGSSGGGLLISGVITMAPELFKGVIIGVPFLDIITTIIEEDQENNIRELGNPEEKKYYEYIFSYAPYENIEAREYPNILITAGFYDTHVYYWPAAKFAAKLRAMKTDLNLLLLRTNMKGGHGGAEFSGRLEGFRERAYEYAFLLDLVGIQR